MGKGSDTAVGNATAVPSTGLHQLPYSHCRERAGMAIGAGDAGEDFRNAAITACSRAQKWEAGLGVPSLWMPRQAVRPDQVSYNAMVDACEKHRQWQKALQLLHDMFAKRIECGNVVFSTSISTCEKGK